MNEHRAVVSSPAELPPGSSAVTIGFFDGVHRGHQTIVGRAVRVAREAGIRAVAVTFDRHPNEVLRPGSQPRYLMSLDRRCRTLLEQGLDAVVVVPFDLERSRQAPEEFVDELLVRGLTARHVVVGSNFRFGHKAAGSIDTLAELGPQNGFTAEAVELVRLDETPVSSTAVREHLEAGDVGWAVSALGRPHWLDGTVVRGAGRGRSLGLPTANVEFDPRLQAPATGVYAAWAEIEDAGAPAPAVARIATRPAVAGEEVIAEAHLLDVDSELYGRHLSLGFAARIRDEPGPPDTDELAARMPDDIAAARDLLSRSVTARSA